MDESEHARISVRAQADGYLVVADTWYPGWVASVDGTEVPIERANLLFRAVRVPAGDHVVEFRYGPESVRLGAIVSGVSIVVAFALFVGLGFSRWMRGARR